DHLGVDNEFDGVLDTSYTLDGSVVTDNFPLSIWNNESFSPEIINIPSNLTYETHSVGNNLTWRALDESPLNYEVFFDDVSQGTNTFTSREFFNVSIDGFDLGETNVTIIFRDSDFNEISETVYVNVVDTVPPDITILSNITFIEGSSDSFLNWSFIDFHPFNYTLFVDSLVNISGLWNNSSPISVNVSHLLKGFYNYTMLVQDTSANYNNSVLLVNIIDGTPPVVSQASNVTYEHGYTGNVITWVATDNYPANYSIFRDGFFVTGGSWNSGENMNISVDDLNPGEYEYEIFVQDTSFWINSTSVYVIVTPDITKPNISVISDFSIFENDTGIVLGWLATDFNPTSYELYVDGSSLVNGTWQDNVQINYTIVNYSPGTYNYSIIVYDITGLNTTRSVLVTVESYLGFFVDHPSDFSFTEGIDGLSIFWTITGNRTGTFIIYQESSNITSGVWVDNQVVNQPLIGLSTGLYNYTIVLNSSTNEIITDTVFITVNIDNSAPIISNYPVGPNITIEYNDNLSLTWQAQDYNPTNYTVYLDNTEMITDVWINNSLLNITLDLLKLGDHNISIIFRDVNGHSTTHEILIIVEDSTSPILSSPADISFTEGSSSTETIMWSVTDDFNGTYDLYRNGVLANTGTWNGSDSISKDLASLAQGNYNFTLVVTDFSGNINSDMVSVDVLGDTTTDPPSSSVFSSTTSSSTLSTTTLQISPGFEYVFVLLMLFVNLSIIRFRRKENK
ncbi:MAG: hypothetical protein ACW99A_21030, partial [Candidatus Kariarchaeaceae archaeon]